MYDDSFPERVCSSFTLTNLTKNALIPTQLIDPALLSITYAISLQLYLVKKEKLIFPPFNFHPHFLSSRLCCIYPRPIEVSVTLDMSFLDRNLLFGDWKRSCDS